MHRHSGLHCKEGFSTLLPDIRWLSVVETGENDTFFYYLAEVGLRGNTESAHLF